MADILSSVLLFCKVIHWKLINTNEGLSTHSCTHCSVDIIVLWYAFWYHELSLVYVPYMDFPMDSFCKLFYVWRFVLLVLWATLEMVNNLAGWSGFLACGKWSGFLAYDRWSSFWHVTGDVAGKAVEEFFICPTTRHTLPLPATRYRYPQHATATRHTLPG